MFHHIKVQMFELQMSLMCLRSQAGPEAEQKAFTGPTTGVSGLFPKLSVSSHHEKHFRGQTLHLQPQSFGAADGGTTLNMHFTSVYEPV